ncbi:MAG: hypothetical protein RMJ00_01990 [Nitrososphaerota archaeon]|nr:hypothetical protein [Candidatus Bathyarchaeota archaeon]MDW8061452.1 hypothetical protein [Nitrososphaerota archaeon]
MREVKISLVGAGSLTFTPSVIKALTRSRLADECKLTVALIDINKDILDVMYKVSSKIVEAMGRSSNIRVEEYTDRRIAFEGTDFAIVTIGVGGVEATHIDVEVPRRYGVEQMIGDTVGPGGIMRGIRHVPVLIDIANDLADTSPNSYLFNYSNPLTVLTRAIVRECRVKAYGLCTGIFGVVNSIARIFGVASRDVKLYIGGINHFYWILDFTVKGEEGYPKLEDLLRRNPSIAERSKLIFDIYRVYGLIAGPGIHVAEFLPHIFMKPEAIARYGFKLFPEGTIYDYKARKPYEELLRNVASDAKPIDELIGVRGMEEEGIGVVNLIESIVLDKPIFYPGVNVVNYGCVEGLPPWSIVEVPAYVDSAGIHPINVGRLPNSIVGLTIPRIMQYELTIDAALSGDRNLAIQAIMLDGYIDDIGKAEKILSELIEAEARWLPRYWFK